MVQASRYLAAYRLGYRGLAERRFIEALVVFAMLWSVDYLSGWTFKFEMVVCVLIVPALAMRFGLLHELKRLFVVRKARDLAK
jgi:hypothetical protein